MPGMIQLCSGHVKLLILLLCFLLISRVTSTNNFRWRQRNPPAIHTLQPATAACCKAGPSHSTAKLQPLSCRPDQPCPALTPSLTCSGWSSEEHAAFVHHRQAALASGQCSVQGLPKHLATCLPGRSHTAIAGHEAWSAPDCRLTLYELLMQREGPW